MAEEGFKRKLTSILSADAVGYSLLMGEDEAATVRILSSYRNVISTLVRQHNGIVIDSAGDNLLAEFVSVVDAVQCAVAVQKELKARNDELPENRRMQFRIGINLGDVIQEEDRIYGDGVNIAARLETLADPGGICISKTAFDHIEAKLPLGYEFLGEQEVKNIAKPIKAYRVLMEPRVTVAVEKKAAEKIPFWRRTVVITCGSAIIAAVIAVAFWKIFLRPPPIEPASVEKMAYPLPDKPSIAVLPFENLSGDPKQEFLSDSISEAIISTLSKVPRMFVIASNSSFAYKGKSVKVRHVAEEFGVQYVLEGSVQRSGEKLRVVVQLVDALKGHHLWSERYDLKIEGLLDLQDKIAMNVLVETQVKLTDGEYARLLRKETKNLKAYEKYLEAEMYRRRTNREDMFKARQLYKEAIRLDPKFSGAYRGVAGTHLWDFTRGWSQDSDKSFQLGTEYAQKALDLDESNSHNLIIMSSIHTHLGNHEKAIELCKRAVEINPNDAFAIGYLAGALFNAGNYEEAVLLWQKIGRLSSLPSVVYFRNLGLFYWFTGQYEEAITASKKALHINPDDITTFRNLAAIYATIDKSDEARAAAAKVLKLNPNFSLERHFKNMPWKDKEGKERFMDALRKAGLPDEKSLLPLPKKPSIAVLPFTNMSADPKQEYFSDGITENIIMALSKTPKLFVIARNSTFVYKDKPTNIKEVAEELGVRYILEGSVQKTANRVRITAQLIDATTARHLWAERYDRELRDIFALQDEITLEIITALQVELTEGEQSRIHRGGTTHLEAFLKVLKGREHHFRYTPEDMEIAKRMYRESIDLDPKYVMAYSHLAGAIIAELNSGWSKSRKKNIELLFELAEKIFSLDSSSGQAHTIMSGYYRFNGQLNKAIAEAEKAVDLDPNDAEGYANGGYVLFRARRYKEAISWFKKAIHRNPSPPIWYLGELCLAYVGNNQHNEAVAVGKKMVKNYPDRHAAYWYLGASYFGIGNYEEAIASFEKGIKRAPTNAWYLELSAMAQSMAGRHEEAIRMVKKAINFSHQESQYNQERRLSNLAEYYRRAGLYEKAIDTSRKLLDYNPNNKHALRAYITLTCAYSAMGSKENAHTAATEVLRINPNFSMEAAAIKDSWAGTSHYDWFLKREPEKNLLLNSLRKAGLQE